MKRFNNITSQVYKHLSEVASKLPPIQKQVFNKPQVRYLSGQWVPVLQNHRVNLTEEYRRGGEGSVQAYLQLVHNTCNTKAGKIISSRS